MFRWLNKQGVESTDGFVLQRMDRYFYHYIEDDRVLKVIVEPGLLYEEIHVLSLQHWQPPFGEDMIADADQKRIRANISTALDFMDTAHKFS